ncbi:guanine nucleotide-binding protein G(s) subunit alpha isoforms XLas-like [Cyanistes caeruleus]|uniref:guanine nucleotide-binding protein G(s) subunit alpha isoforms XLas-like n=1 Tax=Cyanistes caeruleus TaxID=156563 RepID=UPI000CDA07B6|nr:guanine nucleotide-binding protein G(s) subunit alpha isoforms XLas-like [Cyanistes caeruleus]
MRKKREELEKLEEDKMYAELFGDIFSSTDNEESSMMSSCVLRDPSSPTLEPAAEPWVPQSACRVTGGAAAETQNSSELVSPVPLADSGSDSDDSLPLETLLNELLEKWEREEAAGERESEVHSPLSLPPRDEELEPAPTPPDSDVSDEEHSEPLPTALSEEADTSAVCISVPAVDEADTAWMDAGSAPAAPSQDELCRAEAPAGDCPLPAQPLARSAPACPAGSAAVPQPLAPRRWRSIAKTARRALRRLFSFSCLRGQRED